MKLAEAVVADQVFREGGDVDGRATVTADNKAHDEAALMSPKPLDRGGRGGRITHTHADAAHDAKAQNQAGIAFHQPGQNASPGQEESAQGCSPLGSEFVLDSPTRNHEEGKDATAKRVRPGGLSISEVRPADV